MLELLPLSLTLDELSAELFVLLLAWLDAEPLLVLLELPELLALDVLLPADELPPAPPCPVAVLLPEEIELLFDPPVALFELSTLMFGRLIVMLGTGCVDTGWLSASGSCSVSM